jgi:Zn-dependent protease
MDMIRGSFSWEQIIPSDLAILLLSFLILPLHEFSHALAAHWLGDDTAKYNGRLTLNPLKHIDPMGTLALFFIGFGWAKPVPINPLNFRNKKAGMVISALAGPVSNLAAGFLGMIIFHLLARFGLAGNVFVSTFFSYFITVNIYLAVFNFVPIPPLDGSKILSAFLPERLYYRYINMNGMISLVLILLIFTGAISFIVSPIANFFYSVFYTAASFITGTASMGA